MNAMGNIRKLETFLSNEPKRVVNCIISLGGKPHFRLKNRENETLFLCCNALGPSEKRDSGSMRVSGCDYCFFHDDTQRPYCGYHISIL